MDSSSPAQVPRSAEGATHIDGRVYLGDRIDGIAAVEGANPLHITHVLNVSNNIHYSPVKPPPPVQSQVSMRDGGGTDLVKVLSTALAFIEQALADEQSVVLVHCVAGVNRSAIVVMAHLMKSRGMSYEAAFDVVTSKREQVDPVPEYRRQLQQWGAATMPTTPPSSAAAGYGGWGASCAVL